MSEKRFDMSNPTRMTLNQVYEAMGDYSEELQRPLQQPALDNLYDWMYAIEPYLANENPASSEHWRERVREIANNLGETINAGCDQGAIDRIGAYIDELFALSGVKAQGHAHD